MGSQFSSTVAVVVVVVVVHTPDALQGTCVLGHHV
jgi:hypothetical protein